MPSKIIQKTNNFQTCKKELIHNYMDKYSKGQLKNRQDKKIDNPKQAIAISLSVADKECLPKMTNADVKKMEDKLNKFVKNDNVVLSDIKNAKVLIKHYLSEGKNRKAKNTANKIYKTVNKLSKKQKIPEKILQETVSIENIVDE